MTATPYFPYDAFSDGSDPDLDLAADYLELKAAFSENGQSFSHDIINAMELAADADYISVDDEILRREEIATDTITRMESRRRALAASYPFDIDDDGAAITFTGEQPDAGQTAYLVSLILSNLCAVSPLFSATGLHPTNVEVRRLRQYFQYLATAAVAGEIRGPAWSFGFPRPDGTGFNTKLEEIWDVLKDGKVGPDASAPLDPKDDQVDIFAWREHKDGLPGFLLVAAQVATGKNWRSKPIKSHVTDAFPKRWFAQLPAAVMIPYHVIPFARPDHIFRDDVIIFGHILHRLRVPSRVSEAAELVENGVAIEAFDSWIDASEWVKSFLERARTS